MVVAALLFASGRPLPEARAAARDGRWEEAARILAASLRHEPSLALGQGPQREHSQRERSLAALYADVRREYAGYLSATGALEAADRQLQRAKELDRIARTDR